VGQEAQSGAVRSAGLRGREELTGNVSDARRGLADEGQRAAHRQGGKAEAGGEEPVQNALPELRRDPGGEPEPEHLLEQAVADRDAARDGEVAESGARETQEPERTGGGRHKCAPRGGAPAPPRTPRMRHRRSHAG
jgi:hypothetical protein